MNKLLSTLLLVLACMAGQAKTFKNIKAPKAMACVNVYQGELKARQVIMSDTATTVYFTMVYPKGQKFRFAKDSYLMDENGNRSQCRRWCRPPLLSQSPAAPRARPRAACGA